MRTPAAEIGIIGRILPVGSSNRLIMRVYGTDPVFRPGDIVLVARDVPAAPQPEILEELAVTRYPNVSFVTGSTPQKVFSIFTLVRNQSNYERLLKAFADLGFAAANTEFIALDNREDNNFDGYQAVRFA